MLFVILLPCLILVASCQILQCPHPDFLSRNVCETCRSEFQVVEFLKQKGETGIISVFGPPFSNHAPFFRPTGFEPSDPCLNRQPRTAYTCNMKNKRPYCFKVGFYCYGSHSTLTGQLNSEYIHCLDNFTWERQHQMDDFDTNRQSNPEIQ
ncbi:uncharacterized protein LOC111716369 [Eurytemora carolleeae]|uniref:uncharacterized protein LOC111716369 n=1 Tax=Eurytemora carolleeae TaxID=1294199 RepID=UPI000C778BE7|nr:uncharacterized protein LOC111716369 [Eurytemora carolleeae]|eukprot:XP_023347583.1 uncharacterized protein LOC111716369 [Eurytemora affinis]